MKTYQYAIVALGKADPQTWDREARKGAERNLNLLGEDGWKLVAVEGRKAFIMREVVD